jgi:phosphoribosylformylglycinamidine synthase I
MMRPKALILHATGTNRDLEATQALELAGAQAEIIHMNQLRWGERRWDDYQMLVLPGGFSYADALGAGKLLAIDLRAYFAEQVTAFVQQGKAVIGICNGFQALVKAGLLPDLDHPSIREGLQQVRATLTFNACGHFECRWVTLVPSSQRCVWTRGLSELILCPVAHGEGNFVLADRHDIDHLRAADQIALLYAGEDGSPAGGVYPLNPNGSQGDIAGVCNPQGNVLGLMPHPEDHIFDYQHPRWTRGERGCMGLALFQNGVNYAAQL